jgi:hypothetical protein
MAQLPEDRLKIGLEEQILAIVSEPLVSVQLKLTRFLVRQLSENVCKKCKCAELERYIEKIRKDYALMRRIKRVEAFMKSEDEAIYLSEPKGEYDFYTPDLEVEEAMLRIEEYLQDHLAVISNYMQSEDYESTQF